MKRCCWLYGGGPVVIIIIFLQLSLLFQLAASAFLAPPTGGLVVRRRPTSRRSHPAVRLPRTRSPLASTAWAAAASEPRTRTCDDENSDSVGCCSIGVIGCGTIASAIVTGLATAALPASSSGIRIRRITVTPRSAAKSAALQKRFPQLVPGYR